MVGVDTPTVGASPYAKLFYPFGVFTIKKSKLTPTGQRLCEFYQNSDGEGLPSKSVKSLPKIGEDLGVV